MMVDFMYFNNVNPTYTSNQQVTPKKTVRVKQLAANDMHGILGGYRKLMTVTDRFELEKKQNPDIVYSKFLIGDNSVGANRPKNKLVIALENFMNLRAKTIGNHDFDDYGAKGLSAVTDNSKVTALALNLVTKTPNSLIQDDIDAGRIAKSMVYEENGEKFGVIGLVPHDLFNRINQQCKDNCKDLDVLSLEETVKAVQAEVDKMEKQGVNKITLLSHMGYDAEVELIKRINGIDIVHGAHSHDMLRGLVPGKNFFTSQRGEPVILTQASKNGHWYGVTDVVYNEKGTIIAAENNVLSLDKEKDSLKAITAENVMIGTPKKVGELVHDVKSMPEQELDESPMCSFLCDAYKNLTGSDIVFLNAGTMRNTMHKGDVTDRLLIDMMPFYNDISMYKLSEKDVIDAINGGLEATKKYNRTGALQVAGMSYVIGKNGKVKEAYLLKDDGSKVKMNVENPSPEKFYKVAYNSFLSGGTEGLNILKAPEKKIKTFEQNETDLLIEHFKSFNGKPLSIDKTGRITNEA